jgi:hypothetical protein
MNIVLDVTSSQKSLFTHAENFQDEDFRSEKLCDVMGTVTVESTGQELSL